MAQYFYFKIKSTGEIIKEVLPNEEQALIRGKIFKKYMNSEVTLGLDVEFKVSEKI